MVDGARLTFEDGEKAVSLARDVEKQSATISDDLIHGRSLIILGLVLDDFGHRQEALRHLEHAESSNSLVDEAQTSLVFGMILFSANRDTEALKYIEISLTKNSLFGNGRDNATVLKNMGYGYLRRGDYVNALCVWCSRFNVPFLIMSTQLLHPAYDGDSSLPSIVKQPSCL
jgi:tetratricopeptide (TPR) repeat protein